MIDDFGAVLMYKLHGKNVVHMTNSANGIDMHFFYDAQNRPAIVIYNGTAYYYIRWTISKRVALGNSSIP